MENDKIFELIEKMYIDLKSGQDKMQSEISNIKDDVSNIKDDVSTLRTEVVKINVKIENTIEPKLQALFDGYKQTSEKLDRIENEVSRHEEVIIRRVK